MKPVSLLLQGKCNSIQNQKPNSEFLCCQSTVPPIYWSLIKPIKALVQNPHRTLMTEKNKAPYHQHTEVTDSKLSNVISQQLYIQILKNKGGRKDSCSYQNE